MGFADFMAASGQHWWQMLPIGPTGKEDSPYQSLSAFGCNPLLVSPDRLVEKGLLGRKDINLPFREVEGEVNYPAAEDLKLRLFKKAFDNFEKNKRGGRQSDLDAFAIAESFWLEDFSLFSAIQEKEGTSDWTRWDKQLRTRQPDAIVRARTFFADAIRYHQFIQWQFSIQWKELRAYCASKEVCLIGDIPLFVAHQSADVWAHPELFKLDADGKPTVVAGVPPDYFSKTGQVWGVPVYRWETLQDQNYSWWIERLRTAFGRFDVSRLDHFIGFIRTYEVHDQAQSAVGGHVNSVVYTGTHDNDTTAGWYQKLPSTQQKALQKRLGADDQGLVRAMIREALASQADTAIIPAQDLLELKSEARMNTPGTAKGNWQWRLKNGALTQETAQWLKSMTMTCDRLGDGTRCAASRRHEDVTTPRVANL
jgi:4-alpha-glucanotransferase